MEQASPDRNVPPVDDDLPPDEVSQVPVTADMRFEPVRNPGITVLLAEKERTRLGFRPGDDFSLESAIRMGELLRKEWPKRPPLDERALRSHSIRVIRGKHLTLCTDLPPSPEIDRLPVIFDLAVAEYCRFFDVDPESCNGWQMRGCLIDDREKFRSADLLGPFSTRINGYTVDDRLWVMEQKSDYYRRHLLLHEGVHGFMNYVFGACEPAWYAESTAEYLATHRWENGRLVLGMIPENAGVVDGWRRIECVRDDVTAGKLRTVDRLMRLPVRQEDPPTDYAWVWALGFLLDNHPRYRNVFRDMARYLTFPDFSNRFYLRLADHWSEMQVDWLCLLDELVYGYDLSRMVMNPQPGQPLPSPFLFDLDVTRGWQNSGVTLEAGHSYRITAQGRYQLGGHPKVWYSEPNGVTFRYHRGQAIGLVLGAVVPDRLFETETGITEEGLPFLSPIPIGMGVTLTPEQSGTLFLRINDSPAEWDDNKGMCQVTVTECFSPAN